MTTLPPLRVSADFRKQVEEVLDPTETLSSFMLEAVAKGVEERLAQTAFIARGLASARQAKQTGKYVSHADLLSSLETILARAKRKRR